jgi:hypothetical protein
VLAAVSRARQVLEKMGGMSFSLAGYEKHTALCWGHRDIILTGFGSRSCGGGRAELAVGAGHAMVAARYGESDTEILAGLCGPAPTDAVFTWAEAKKLLHIR